MTHKFDDTTLGSLVSHSVLGLQAFTALPDFYTSAEDLNPSPATTEPLLASSWGGKMAP